MAKRYDPIMCMMVDEPTKAQDAEKLHYYQHSYTKKWYVVSPDGKVFKEFNTEAEAKNYVNGKAHDELSLAQKKQVVNELKGYLKKSYNFGDESEYARAYEDLRHMFTTGSRKSISGLFENTVKKTGAHDAKSLGKYKLPNGEIVEVIDRKNVHGVDTIVYKNSRGVHFATVDWFMSNAKKVYDSAKAKDRLVKVPDNKLKEFEANLRSAGFKVVSKSDRGMTTHYQVEVNSSKTFTEADLREWANKIDSVCDKMDSVAPTTWNIGLTADGKITAGLDVREMYVKDSASALDKAIKTADGMFASAFGEYTKGAKFKKDKFLKELAGISDAEELAKRIQTLDNELKNNLERLDEAYNVASKDYYAARNEIRSIMDAFSREAFSLYKKLDKK